MSIYNQHFGDEGQEQSLVFDVKLQNVHFNTKVQ